MTSVHPKLPMRDQKITEDYYLTKLGFRKVGTTNYADYLMLEREGIQIHFFDYATLNPKENYGQVYIRTTAIDELYQSFLNNKVIIHPNGKLQNKPWGQREFALLDPDHNLLTFGQEIPQ